MATLFEGGGRVIRSTDNPPAYTITFSSEATVYDSTPRPAFASKAEARAVTTYRLHRLLNTNSVPAAFVTRKDTSTLESVTVETLPFTVTCRSHATGSFATRCKSTAGLELPVATVEFTIGRKRPQPHPPVTTDTLPFLTTITDGMIKLIQSRTLIASSIISQYLASAGYVLAEIQFEFARDEKDFLLIFSEISPETLKAWKMSDYEKIDRAAFMREVGMDEKSYTDFANRIGS